MVIHGGIMKRRYMTCIILTALTFICGCETIGAFGTGRMTSSDVAYITHAGTSMKKVTPVNVNDPYAEEENENLSDAERGPRPRKSNVDEWLEENLW
jgi:hypothetical protein